MSGFSRAEDPKLIPGGVTARQALVSNSRIIYGMPFMIVLLIAGNFFWSKQVPVTVILGASLIYGFLPSVTHYMRLIGKKAEYAENPKATERDNT
jgi:hypothetical protein